MNKHSHARDHAHSHHTHEHDGDHEHEHGGALSEMDLRVRAIESLLVEKGLVDPIALDRIVETYETKVGPRNGAIVVAKAWFDASYRNWLLRDADGAIGALGFTGRQGEHVVVVENTAATHNLVVCTLCSCYPWPLLGLPPAWYKSTAYRSRAVIDPRGVLQDFGIKLSAATRIAVWDSTAEIRYLVLPERPKDTDGWTQEELATLVTRDSMIGTGLARQPSAQAGVAL